MAAPLAPLALAEIGAPADPQIDPLWMLRQSLAEAAGARSGPAAAGCPTSGWRARRSARGLRQLARGGNGGVQAGYSTPAGSEALRMLIARRLLDQGVVAAPDHILLTDSGTHAVDLVLRFLIEPGDTVLLDDPCYFNFQGLLRAHRAKMVGVPMAAAGTRTMEAIRPRCWRHAPRPHFTNVAVHNPDRRDPVGDDRAPRP